MPLRSGIIGFAHTAVGNLRAVLPEGGALPLEDWHHRHRALVWFLWFNVPALFLYGTLATGYTLRHLFLEFSVLGVLALGASWPQIGRKARSLFASVGLLTSAALLVHLTGGLIEAHFYFFVLVIALTLYEEWLVFLAAVAYVLLHHGVLGMLDPHEVFNRPEAWAAPWKWAAIHAAFVAMAGVAGVAAWRLNERVRESMRVAQRDLEEVSRTDALTGLGNRRKLMSDLEVLMADPARDALLVLLDLNGFKAYNDLFGHPAGDALLSRLGRRLDEAVNGKAHTYRPGGDEFCVMVYGAQAADAVGVEARAAAALRESGDGFSVSASHGSVSIPLEASTRAEALRLADRRMYACKNSSRLSSSAQTRDVLLRVLVERHPELERHGNEVSELAQAVARALALALGLDDEDVDQIARAAELHDVGKVAIPDAIINKPGPLDEAEWEFMRRHTLIGERIVDAAPSLARVGQIIRSSHERWDGHGYPDRRAGEEIPLGARIISVCDSYDAMTSDRAYRIAMSHEGAMAELRRCSGAQFDPRVVAAFEQAMAERHARVLSA